MEEFYKKVWKKYRKSAERRELKCDGPSDLLRSFEAGFGLGSSRELQISVLKREHQELPAHGLRDLLGRFVWLPRPTEVEKRLPS